MSELQESFHMNETFNKMCFVAQNMYKCMFLLTIFNDLIIGKLIHNQ